MANPTYSIVIPAYNESERLRATLDRVTAYVAEKKWDAEVLVVNDGSRDNTRDIILEYAARHSCVRLVDNPGNRGKGYSVRHGMLEARGEFLLFSDADLASPIEEAEKLFEALRGGVDVAVGSRWLDPSLQTVRQPFYRRVLGRTYNLLLRVVLRLKLKDTQCGFKAFTRPAAEAVFPRQIIERWGFDPEILYLARHLGFKTREVAVHWAHRENTKIHPFRDGLRMFGELLRIRWYAVSGRYKGEIGGTFDAVPPASRSTQAGREMPVTEETPTPPTPDRVAARALVLSAVACRGLIERDAEKPGAEQLRKNVIEWLNRIGVSAEMERSEVELLSTPLGKLDKKTTMETTWSSEGMVVLAWVLGCAPLPSFYAECQPSDVANALGFLEERETTVLRKPTLRNSNEIVAAEETYLTLHWRLRQFSIEPCPMDFAAYVSSCSWGPLRLEKLELCEGDLAVEGVRIDRLDYAVFRRTLSIVQERHRAFNWLIGWDSVYSQVTTDT